MQQYGGRRMWLATTKGGTCYTDVEFRDEDMILFGRETAGLPRPFIAEHKECAVRIPMSENTRLRSLNLANSANIVMFEALRQLGFPGMTETPTTYEEICEVVKKASENEMKGILEYVDDEVVSSDFLGDPHTSIFDAREGITLNNQLFKIILYYDNEFGYATKTLELAKYMNEIDNK